MPKVFSKTLFVTSPSGFTLMTTFSALLITMFIAYSIVSCAAAFRLITVSGVLSRLTAYRISPISGSFAKRPSSRASKARSMVEVSSTLITRTDLSSLMLTLVIFSVSLGSFRSIKPVTSSARLTPVPSFILVNSSFVCPASTFACKASPRAVMIPLLQLLTVVLPP